MSDSRKLEVIRRAARRAETRIRLGRALQVVPLALVGAIALSAIVLTLRKVWPHLMPEAWAVAAFVVAAVGALVAVAVPFFRKVPPRAGALALDRHHGANGRLTNAVAFAELGQDERTAWMDAAIDDAASQLDKLEVGKLEPSKAVKIPVPLELAVATLMIGALALLALLFVPQKSSLNIVPLIFADETDRVSLTGDDLDYFRDRLGDLENKDDNEDVKRAIDAFNKLIEDIAKRRLNRTEAFRKLQEIETELNQSSEADRKALEEALKEMAKELDKSDMSKELGESLKKNDLAQAQKDLEKLAQQLRDKENKPDKAALERLRKALSRAAQRKEKALEQLRERRAELRKQLLKKKKEIEAKKKPTEQDKRLLKKKKRELDRLTRDIKRREDAARKLSRLDRNLAKAAEDLLRELGMSAEDFEKAAEDLNRLEREQMSDKEKEELRKRLEELRQQLRNKGGREQMKRLRRFMKQARGQQGQGQKPGGTKPGQGGQPGEDGEGMKPGGKGGKPGGFMIGPGGKKIPIPGPGMGPGGQGDQPGPGGGDGGDQAGTGRGPDVRGQETNPDLDTHDVRAEGLDTGTGRTDSEAILAAAERGFRGKKYGKLYKDYQTVAEDQIDKEEIPDGMRSYVRRYFQLIRPRE